MKLSVWAKEQGISYQAAWRMYRDGQLPVPAEILPTGTIILKPPQEEPTGVAVYARVSSSDQRSDLDGQVARVVEFVTRQGWPVVRTVTEVGCVSKRCVELAGEATEVTKQPCSWWAASVETLPSKPHDKVATGGEQARGPYDEESCVSAVSYPRERKQRKPSPSHLGEGHGRCEELGCAALKNPPA